MSTEDIPSYLFVHFKAKTALERYLSSMYPKRFRYNGYCYHSIEHAFAGSKYLFLEEGAREDLMYRFTCDGIFGSLQPLEVKGKGGKGQMKKDGVSLDVLKWNKTRLAVMRDVAAARFKDDSLFRKIIRKAKKEHVPILHYGPRGDTFWGGSFGGKEKVLENFSGNNHYGQILQLLV